MTELQFPLSPERAARLLLAWMRANGGVGSGIKGHTTDRALYHGTINVSLQSIRARGLQAKHSGKFYRELSKTGNIYVTTDKELAAKYAVEAASRYNMNGRYGTRDVTPVVLEVHVPNSATGKLSVDEKEDVGRQGTGIKFKGDIPPAWIKGVARVSVPAETYDSPPQIPVVGQFKTFEDEGDVVYVPWAVELDEPRGLGGPGSGIKGHTTQHKSAIGYVDDRGAVHTKLVPIPDDVEHAQFWSSDVPTASKFRYYAPRTGHGSSTPGTIAWNDQPSADDYFAAQDHLERQGLPVGQHVHGVIGAPIAEPKPRLLGGVGSGIKGHTTNRNPFASSKVPNVVYHASHGVKEFSAMADRPVYFADSPRTTEFGKHEAEAFIDIKNPYLPGGMDDDEVLGRLSERDAENILGEGQRPDAGTTWHEALRESLVRGTEAPWQEKPFLDAVKASGFDGVISADTHGGKREYVVFSPREQIKTLGGVGSGIRGHVTLHNADARLTKAVEWLNEKRPELMAHVQHVALRPTSPIRLGNYEHATRTINVFRHGHGTGAYIKTIAHEATHAAQKARGERFIKGQMSAQEAEARHAGNDARNEYHGIKGLGGVGSGIRGHVTERVKNGKNAGPSSSKAAVAERAKQAELAAAQTNPLAHPEHDIVLGLNREGKDTLNYVAAYGQEHTPQPLPAQYERGTQKECYKNASLLVLNHPELTYAEGFAKSDRTGDLTFMHAWAVDAHNNVVDPTWDRPENGKYFGVKYDRTAYLKYLYTAKIYGVLGSTHNNARRAIDTGVPKMRALGDVVGHEFHGNQWAHGGAVSDNEKQLLLKIFDNVPLQPAARLNLPIRQGIASNNPRSGFGQCTQLALAEHRATGSDVYVGYAVPKVLYGKAVEDFKLESYRGLRLDAIPHAWNVKDGAIVDRAFGSREANKHVYIGAKVPDASLQSVTHPDQLASWSTLFPKALGGPGSGIRGHHTDREDMPRHACATKVGRFNYATLGDRLFLINPRTGDVVFGAAGQENATSTGLEGESYVTHAETFADAKQEHDLPGSYDDYAKGQVTPPDKLADRIGSIAIRDGGTGDVTGMSMDEFNAARFHGYAAVVDAFRQAGAGPETRVYGFDQLGGDYTHRMTLGELKLRGLGGVGSGIKGHTTQHDHGGIEGNVDTGKMVGGARIYRDPAVTDDQAAEKIVKYATVVNPEALRAARLGTVHVYDNGEDAREGIKLFLGSNMEVPETGIGLFSRDSRTAIVSLYDHEETGSVFYHELGHAQEAKIVSPEWRAASHEWKKDRLSGEHLDQDEGFAHAFADWHQAKYDEVHNDEIAYPRRAGEESARDEFARMHPQTQELFTKWNL